MKLTTEMNMLQLEDFTFLNKGVLVCITPTGCVYKTRLLVLVNETNAVSKRYC